MLIGLTITYGIQPAQSFGWCTYQEQLLYYLLTLSRRNCLGDLWQVRMLDWGRVHDIINNT
jgi:hypothetical protein